ncbi:PROTEIN TIFY 10A-LIKE [Salix viminalis]|uniref:Protein TIFY n=1 Tax=Salix viminalis TaxID=40686 RepID=A0A9Q0TNM0_SALVM|nr:PROTEIN TIFY 10A-LIKE [Salix viminalis]
MENLAQNSCRSPDQISNFAKKCNLLSQYLKEKGSFGDISLGINGRAPEDKGPETYGSPATTLNLLGTMESSSQHMITLRQKTVASAIMNKSMGFQFVGFSPSNSADDADIRKSSGTAPMTLFYAGKVTVFKDIPADKAEEIMALATKGSPVRPSGFHSDPALIKVNPANSAAALDGPGVPHATRASLLRFFSKRKERVAARAPYQTHNPTQDLPSSSRPEAGSNPLPALDGGQYSSTHLELKL